MVGGPRCPKCDEEMWHQEAEQDVGIQGLYVCDKCEKSFDDLDYYEPIGDEVI